MEVVGGVYFLRYFLFLLVRRREPSISTMYWSKGRASTTPVPFLREIAACFVWILFRYFYLRYNIPFWIHAVSISFEPSCCHISNDVILNELGGDVELLLI